MFDLTSALTDVFDRKIDERLELDEERMTIAAAKLGDGDATMRLVRAYAPVLKNAVSAVTRAVGITPGSTEIEDLRSQAVVGLLEAIQAFDATTYDRLAAIVRNYVRDAVAVAASAATQFTVPERTLKRFFGILRAADGNVYEAAALAPEYEMKTETFLAVLSAVRSSSYEAVSDDGVGEFTGRGHEDEMAPLWSSSSPIADVEDRILVEAAFAAVDTVEGDVCRLAYGFADFDPQPDAEIAHRMGLSRPKVQRTRSSALTKMRSALGVA